MHQGSATSSAGCAQDQRSSPQPVSTAAVVTQTIAFQSGSGRGLGEDEEEKAPADGSPTSSLAAMWTGPALHSSLKQAIADQPASTLAQPINLGDSDSAKRHPSRAANQRATLPMTPTSPAHPNPPDVPKTAYQTLRAQEATSHPGMGSNKGVVVGANKQNPQVTKQPESSPSGAGVAQGTAARAGAGSGAVAAQAEAETSADSHVSTAGRAHCSSGHSQDHGRPARRLEIRMVPARPELVNLEYPLYYKYQVSNHHDKPSKVREM